MTVVKSLGEVLKVLKETELGGVKFIIEQNEPLVQGGSRVIHLQNEKFRMEMPEPLFLKFAGAIAWSRKKFDDMKGWQTK